jgi:hypothetical protein
MPLRSPQNFVYLSLSEASSSMTSRRVPVELMALTKPTRHNASSEAMEERMVKMCCSDQCIGLQEGQLWMRCWAKGSIGAKTFQAPLTTGRSTSSVSSLSTSRSTILRTFIRTACHRDIRISIGTSVLGTISSHRTRWSPLTSSASPSATCAGLPTKSPPFSSPSSSGPWALSCCSLHHRSSAHTASSHELRFL